MPRYASVADLPELSQPQRDIIESTLHDLLNSVHFSRSRRYRAFLEHVVLSSVSGDLGALKERMIGLQVFSRPAEYDVANDPVVRIAAGEVRKRLARFYETHTEAPVRIVLPLGSYLAEFHFIPPAETAPRKLPEAPASTFSPSLDMPTALPSREFTPLLQVPPVVPRVSPARFALLATLVMLLLAGSVFEALRHGDTRQELWRPLVADRQPPLILVGQSAAATTEEGGTVRPWAVGRMNLVMDDAFVVAGICGITHEHHHTCDMQAAPHATLATVHGRPVILIGAFANEWTTRILAPLRYQTRIVHADATGQPDILQVFEHMPSGDTILGAIQAHRQGSASGKDYAILARFHSITTESPALVIAGLDPEGTTGAWKFVTSSASLHQLFSRAPKHWAGDNFEAVLQIDTVNGSSGRLDIVAASFW